MALETTELNQIAVLWAFVGSDDNGEATVSAGVEINVRWVESTKQAATARSTPTASDVTVVVDRDIAIDSIMRLGRRSAVPAVPTDLYRVVNLNKTPDLKARAYRREVSLQRFKDALPTIV